MESDTVTLTITIEDEGKRLDKLLSEKFPEYSRVQIQVAIRTGQMLVNEITSKPAYHVTAGDSITFTPLEKEKSMEIVPQEIPLDVIYEDEYLVAINKPAGLVVHPGFGNQDGTLVNALLARYPQVADVGDLIRAGIVHRLDKDTSGIILVALTEQIQRDLIEQFKVRDISKFYVGLVENQPRTESGHIDAPIGRDPKKRKRMAVIQNGKSAQTDYFTLENFENHTLLELHPHTGRTHQLRVHLAFIGCPIVGDRVYGFRKQIIKLKRLFLHAKSITFLHPVTGKEMHLNTELPDKLENILIHLRQLEVDRL